MCKHSGKSVLFHEEILHEPCQRRAADTQLTLQRMSQAEVSCLNKRLQEQAAQRPAVEDTPSRGTCPKLCAPNLGSITGIPYDTPPDELMPMRLQPDLDAAAPSAKQRDAVKRPENPYR